MHCGRGRLSALGCLALLLGGCADQPLSPDEERAALSAQGSLTAPSNLIARAVSTSQVDLAWRDESSGETGFEVQRSTTGPSGTFVPLTKTGANITTYSNSGLGPSTQYCYKVRAVGGSSSKLKYSAFSNAACATTPAPPPPPPPPGPKNPPSGLIAVATGPTISLTWTDDSSDEEGFRVERSPTGNDPWTLLYTIYGPNATITSDATQPEQQLCYRVKAFNKEGNSAPSNVDCATVIFAPTNLLASQVDDRTLDLSWTNRSTLGDAVELYRAPTRNDPFLLIATVAGTATVYRDRGLTPNSSYWYTVRAKRQDDVSDSYAVVSGSTATMPPNAPSELLAYPTSSTSLVVWWQDNSLNESGYRVEQSDDGGTSWRTSKTIDFADQRVWTNENAVTEHTVCYRVLAFNSAGESSTSNFACTAPPAAATELTATRIDATTVELTWRDNSGVEDGYDILQSTDGFVDNMEVIGHVAANATTFRDNNASWFAYPYRVRPTRDGGLGTWSNYVEVSGF
jgi:fibronectin type III domain protein